MKKDTHPEYFEDAKVTCACGNTFTTGSTAKELRVELCSHCHPFFTGKSKVVDTQGRVERFQRMAKKSEGLKPTKSKKQRKGERLKAKTTRKDK